MIKTSPGQRKFRNEVDYSGVAEPVILMNLQAEKATRALFTAFEMEGMMNLNTTVADAA